MEDTNTETKTEDQKPTVESGVSPSDVRKHDLFLKQTQENKALREQLDAIKKAQADEAVDLERKKLEAKGRYEEIIADMKREKELIEEKHSRQILDLNLKASLIKAGVTNDTFLKGAMVAYSGDETGVDDYIESLKTNESNAIFFGTEKPGGHRPPPSASPGTRSSHDWAAIKQDLQSKDPVKAKAADEAVRAHIEKTGEMPW